VAPVNRRTFLAGLLGSPLARVLPKALISAAPAIPVARQVFQAQLLPFTTPNAWYIKTRAVSVEVFRRELAQGLNDVFVTAYDRHADDWSKLYDSGGQ
jgi:hypothetical protein